ncbi:AraC family transcriptional regulator [Microvirga massiliensis]|uniref:AraC family transcriptional regulator n=1 Tax=Microvirga massiliensis TaxID=1033741 RepID=UPI00066083A1|nr:AraC family transcriptional regulator [Microvirga massiliensis]
MRWLEHCIAGSDPILCRVFEGCIWERKAALEKDLKESLRRVLRAEIPATRYSATSAAGRFAVQPRLPSRRLHADGAGFQSLVAEARCEIARQLRAQTKISLSLVAAVLKYSEPSAFTRWSEQPPSAWRASHVRTSA